MTNINYQLNTKQAGNAVAVPVVQAIGTKIKQSLVNFLTETGIYRLIKQEKQF